MDNCIIMALNKKPSAKRKLKVGQKGKKKMKIHHVEEEELETTVGVFYRGLDENMTCKYLSSK